MTSRAPTLRDGTRTDPLSLHGSSKGTPKGVPFFVRPPHIVGACIGGNSGGIEFTLENMDELGVIYLATGRLTFVQMCMLSMASLRSRGFRGPVAIVSDLPSDE